VLGGAALTIVLLPIAGIAALFAGKRDASIEEVIQVFRAHLHGGGGSWDWDDFISVPIKNPALESIRARACDLDDPTSDQSLRVIEGLLAEAEAL
jgi:hypothetical protein